MECLFISSMSNACVHVVQSDLECNPTLRHKLEPKWIDGLPNHEVCTRLVLRSLYVFHSSLFVSLHFRTYHMHNNYVTYMYTVAMRFTVVNVMAVLWVLATTTSLAHLQVRDTKEQRQRTFTWGWTTAETTEVSSCSRCLCSNQKGEATKA